MLVGIVLAATVTHVAVPLVIAVARAARAMDYSSERRMHLGAIPRLGGIAIALGLVFGAGVAMVLAWEMLRPAVESRGTVALVIASAMVFLAGLAEDLVGISPWMRLVVECAAALVLVAMGWRFVLLGVPGFGDLHLGWFGLLLTVLWFVGVTNAINLIDGLDGLAGGVVGIIAASYLVLCLLQGDLFTSVLAAAMVGACFGFLGHNWAPAKIFMGDGGSLTLGFLLAAIAVHSSLKASGAVAILVPILALGVPVIDTLLVMAARFVRLPGSPLGERMRRVFRADRSHLHHLLAGSWSRRTMVVRMIYLLVLLSCTGAAYVSITKRGGIGILLVLGEIVVLVIIRKLGWAARVASSSSPAEAVPDGGQRAGEDRTLR